MHLIKCLVTFTASHECEYHVSFNGPIVLNQQTRGYVHVSCICVQEPLKKTYHFYEKSALTSIIKHHQYPLATPDMNCHRRFPGLGTPICQLIEQESQFVGFHKLPRNQATQFNQQIPDKNMPKTII